MKIVKTEFYTSKLKKFKRARFCEELFKEKIQW